MKLYIGDKFYIESDPLNFTMYQYKTIVNKRDKTERQDWVFVGHFPKIQIALSRILQEDLRVLEEADVERVIEQIKLSEKAILKAVKEYHLNKERVKEDKDETEEE